MENIYMIESCELDIFFMENELKFNNKMNMLNIQLMESVVSEKIYTEGVIENITDFFNTIIEKLKELIKKAKTVISNKMTEIEFQKKAKEIKTAYASNKIDKSKKIKIFDYLKYRKEISNIIKQYHNIYIEISKRDFKTYTELASFFMNEVDKINRDFKINPDDYWVYGKLGEITASIDKYPNIIVDTMNDIDSNIGKEIEQLKNLSHKEVAKEKTDPENVSKISIYKKIANKLVDIDKPLMSKASSIILTVLKAISVIVLVKGAKDFSDTELNGGMAYIPDRRKWQGEIVAGAVGTHVTSHIQKEMK